MRSLNAHLTEAGSHGHLPFHPGCPVCRAERLAGRVAREPVLSRRAQASLLAAVLALSTGGLPAAVATAQAPGDEGAAAPDAGKSPDEDEPDFDPGDEVPLPNEVPEPPPAAAGGDDDDTPGGPVEGEPQEQLGSPRGPGAAPVPQPPSGPPAGSVGQPVPAPPAVAPTTPVAPTGQPPALDSETPEQGHKRPGKHKEKAQRPAPGQAAGPEAGPRVAPGSAPAPASPPLAPASAPAVAVPVTESGARAADGRVHVVRPGESLWSIASDQLGSASAAQITQQVNRLWELNKQHIATGDPDLLMVGTTLELPSRRRG